MSDQSYEDYWKYTNAYTDYNGDKFLGVLKVCVDCFNNSSKAIKAYYDNLLNEAVIYFKQHRKEIMEEGYNES